MRRVVVRGTYWSLNCSKMSSHSGVDSSSGKTERSGWKHVALLSIYPPRVGPRGRAHHSRPTGSGSKAPGPSRGPWLGPRRTP